jgi:NAD(P)-dependent dehydrogenase (short-subunit alcohol dehydrogenase family)
MSSSTCTSLTVVLSGATGSIGGQIAQQLASNPAVSRLVLLGRNEQKLTQLVSNLPGNKTTFELVDLSSVTSLLACVDSLKQKLPHINSLVNNAATVPATRETTSDGLEMQFGTNVMSYYVLMTRLLPLLSASGNGKVINVASDYAGGFDIDDLHFTRRAYDSTASYKQSKQANRMISWESSKRGFPEANVSVAALMPGVVTSNLLQSLGMRSGFDEASAAAQGPVYLATEANLVPGQAKYYHGRKGEACQWENHKDNAKLWDELERIVASEN